MGRNSVFPNACWGTEGQFDLKKWKNSTTSEGEKEGAWPRNGSEEGKGFLRGARGGSGSLREKW